MNGSIFWRVVWKEYRTQRAFWIAMAVLTGLLQLIVAAVVTQTADRINMLFHLGLAFPAFYALGCGATLFATEHETGTYEFQRSLPVTGWRLFLGKLACAVVATSAMVAAFWCLALVFSGGRLPAAATHRIIWGLWGVAAVEGLLWGILFSLLSKWPLRAAILAMAVGSCFVHSLTAEFGSPWEARPYLAAVPHRAVVIAVVALADAWLGYRWFRGEATVSHFWRLVWKECRVQRVIWISVAILTVLLQLVVAKSVTATWERANLLFHLAVAFPTLYALGCGATLFATKREPQTCEFRPTAPDSTLRSFFSRLACAVVGVPLMIGVLIVLVPFFTGGRLPTSEIRGPAWTLWGLAGFEGLAWGAFFSLLLKGPLRTAILALLAIGFCVHFASLGFGTPGDQLHGYQGVVPYRVALAVVVALADVWLGYRWFRDGRAAARGIGRLKAGDEMAWTSIVRPSPVTIFGRLVWQQWRQSVGTMAVIGIVILWLAAMGRWVWFNPHYALQEKRLAVVMFLAAVTASLMGCCVFLADQRRGRYRYLAEHGLQPQHVWLSRQLLWMVPLVLLACVLLPLFFLGNESLTGLWHNAIHEARRRRNWFNYDVPRASVLIGDLTHVGMLLACMGLGYSSGQLCSMLFRSGVLAGVFGLIATVVLCGWAGLMWLWDVSWWWTVAPIPLVLMLASWLRAPGWMLQRNRLRAWLPAVLVLLVPMAASLTAVPLCRIYSVPEVSPGFSPDDFDRPITPEEQKTADMYRRAAELIVPWSTLFPRDPNEDEDSKDQQAMEKPFPTAEDIAHLKANEQAISLAIEASGRDACSFSDPRFFWRRIARDNLHGLLLRSGGILQAEGKLDAALGRYLAALRFSVHLRHRARRLEPADWVETRVYRRLGPWAAHPGQTAERIQGALAQLDRITKCIPSRGDAIKTVYLRTRRIIGADPAALASINMRPSNVSKITLWARCLPWEPVRAGRLLNRLTAEHLQQIELAEAAAERGERLADYQSGHYDRYSRREPEFALREEIRLPGCWVGAGGDSTLIRDFTEMEAKRRVVRLLLALQAWKREHGRVPETLDDLVGPYLDRIPADPFTGEPFRYFADGVAAPLKCGRFAESEAGVLAAGEPFVWCAGWGVQADVRIDEQTQQRTVGYSIYDDWRGVSRGAVSEFEIWQRGWLFPVR